MGGGGRDGGGRMVARRGHGGLGSVGGGWGEEVRVREGGWDDGSVWMQV